MFKKKHIAMVIAMVLVFSTMAGCSKKSDTYSTEYKDGFMRVFHDGKIYATYVEDFDEDEYNKDELKKMVDDEIAEFNEKYSEDNGMSLENFRVEDDEARVKLAFKTVDDYILYSEKYVNSEKKIEMFVGTYDDAVSAGYDIKGELKVPKKKEKIDAEELSDKEDTSELYVLYTTEGNYIRVDGKVKYINKNVKVDDDKLIITSDENDNYIFYTLEDKK